MRPNKEVLVLPCNLTDEEILKLGVQLAAERPKEEQLDNELKEFSSQVKANKEKIRSQVAHLSNLINLKKEFREVNCSIRYDFERNEKIWIRLDTGEIVKKTNIPTEEMQEALPLETSTEEGSNE